MNVDNIEIHKLGGVSHAFLDEMIEQKDPCQEIRVSHLASRAIDPDASLLFIIRRAGKIQSEYVDFVSLFSQCFG